MLKKLTEEQQARLIDTAILEFADKGFKGAGLSRIAKNAGVSVGVIYKYYEDKDALFAACVKNTLDYLDTVLQQVGAVDAQGADLPELVRALVHQVQTSCKDHPEYFRMYHQITAGNASEQGEKLAELIERPSAQAYKAALMQAVEEKRIDERLDPGAGAFFFDNLLMMLHYAYSCAYYKERMDIYCGKQLAASEEKMEDQMVRFVLNGLGYKE